MKKYIAFKANRHLHISLEMIKLKYNNLAIYGKEYSNTLEYAKIELNEHWHLLMFKILEMFIK